MSDYIISLMDGSGSRQDWVIFYDNTVSNKKMQKYLCQR